MSKLPKSVTVNTGEEEKLSKTINDFFAETVNIVETTYLVERRDFLIESGQIAFHHSQITDNRITYISYRDRILAGVLETRTEFNRIRYTFFRTLKSLDDLRLARRDK